MPDQGFSDRVRGSGCPKREADWEIDDGRDAHWHVQIQEAIAGYKSHGLSTVLQNLNLQIEHTLKLQFEKDT